MLPQTTNRNRRRVPAAALLLALVAGLCVLPVDAAVDKEPVHPPAYRSGDTFVYADGTWETVVGVSPGEVVWKDHQGFLSSGSPDFTRRRAQWESPNLKGARAFGPRDDLLISGETTVWPLAEGRKAQFKEAGTMTEKGGPETAYTALWSCQVSGMQSVSVPAGIFDTWKIDCSRHGPVGNSFMSRLWENWTWYYAPVVGHYVLSVSTHVEEPKPRHRELLAVLPPDEEWPAEARQRMEESLQRALESHPSGRPLGWGTPGPGLSGEAVPSGTFRAADGTFCRRYVQRIESQGGWRDYHGMACRTPGGRWEVPRR